MFLPFSPVVDVGPKLPGCANLRFSKVRSLLNAHRLSWFNYDLDVMIL